MTYTTGTLSLSFYDRQGNPLTNGTVLIVPNAPLVKDTTGHKVLSGSVSVVIGKTATYPVTVALPATDDETLDPAGVTYTVTPPKKWGNPVTGVAIYAGQTRHFADLVSVDPASPTYQPGDVTRAEYDALLAVAVTYNSAAVALDTDGVPYYSPGGVFTDAVPILADTDGVPYFSTGA